MQGMNAGMMDQQAGFGNPPSIIESMMNQAMGPGSPMGAMAPPSPSHRFSPAPNMDSPAHSPAPDGFGMANRQMTPSNQFGMASPAGMNGTGAFWPNSTAPTSPNSFGMNQMPNQGMPMSPQGMNPMSQQNMNPTNQNMNMQMFNQMNPQGFLQNQQNVNSQTRI